MKLWIKTLMLAGLMGSTGFACLAQVATKIIDHGPDGEKLVFVVLGDGYGAADQQKFKNDVSSLVIDGVFGHDFYKDNVDAFNVYRVDLTSEQSGVSTPTFAKNTALKVIYSGQWDRCWLEPSDDTDQMITSAINIKKYDFVLIIANESGYGGCRRGSRLYVTSGDPWDVLAHEYGHGIAGLYDEYSVDGSGPYTGDPVNNLNCSTLLDRHNVVWSKQISSDIDLPSDDASNIDTNNTVGEFKGCNYAQTAIYRPVQLCRMNSNTPHFCPVCLAAMTARVKPYRTVSRPNATGPQAAPIPASTFVNLVVRIDKDRGLVIQKASQIAGRLVQSSSGSPAYIAALTKGGQPNVAHLITDDPFIVRGFRDPDHIERGEHISQSTSATVVINVANSTLASVTTNVGLQLYSVKGGQHLSALKPSQLRSVNELKRLIDLGSVKQVLDISAKSLSDKINAAPIK